MASLEKTFLDSLKHRYNGELTTKRSHLRQALRLDRWRMKEVNDLITDLRNKKTISVTGTKTHITLKLKETS